MGLSKKTFLYSMAIAGLMVAFVIGYFVLMLPSLYVDYVMESNLGSVMEIQRGYMEDRTYDDLPVKNPTAAYSLEIPDEGTNLYVAGKFFKLTVEVRDEELQQLLNHIRNRINGVENMTEPKTAVKDAEEEDFSALWGGLKEKFAGKELFTEDYPVAVQVEKKGDWGVFQEEYEKVHRMSDGLIVYEAGASDGNYGYTTYVAMAHTEDAFIVTVLPTLTPRMDEIIPVVMGSLPMIIAVVFLLILISSRFFSGKIVNPIIRLAGYAQSAKIAEHFETDAFDLGNKDEIGTLATALQELYEKLRDNYLELEQKNCALEEENIRQEVFLRASSHQLKTPISAALLLVEGMMNEVGKYKNTREYLPEVKSQLLAMRRIVEDILQLNYHAENMQQEMVAVETLAEELVRACAVQIEDKKLQVTLEGSGMISTDREIMKKIMDNLLSNAVQYTPEGERIEIEVSQKEFAIKNYGITIDEKLLPNIFEPFVSSDESRKGKGLGLYVASYYSRLLGCRIITMNMENGVCTRLIFASWESRMQDGAEKVFLQRGV